MAASHLSQPNSRTLPRYDPTKSYQWNYDHAPEPVEIDVPKLLPGAGTGKWSFCGLPVASPLGVPAGPLLNGKWVLYYASLGFDVLTYKTVRSGERPCYDLPNLQPVNVRAMRGDEGEVAASNAMRGTWAVSFGMPSMSPDVWRSDVEATRRAMPAGKVLSVSVVGTVQPRWSLDDLAADYAQCAAWAVESGAQCVETNFSCPNVSTVDGQLYQQCDAAGRVAAAVREAIGRETPYIIKIGHVPDDATAAALLDAVGEHVTAIAMTNSVAAKVRNEKGELMFDGEPRGICGDATFDVSVEQVRRFKRLIDARGLSTRLIGVGGASRATHVRAYLDADAEAVHIASAAMVDPLVAVRIKQEMSRAGREEKNASV